MKCPSCGTENREGNRFCRRCGARLTAAAAPGGLNCPRCATANPPGRRFCRHCGAPLTAETAAADEVQQAVALLAGAVQAAEQALRQAGQPAPAALGNCLQAVRARLDAGRRALAAKDLNRARTLLTGPAPQQEVSALQQHLAAFQADRQQRAQILQQGEAPLVAVLQEAEKALRQAPLADPTAVTAARHSVQARLEAGRRALAAGDLERARSLLTSRFAQEDAEALRQHVAELLEEQQRKEQQRDDLDRQRRELEARVKAVDESLTGLAVDLSSVRREISDLRARLKAGEGARKRGNLEAAQQTFAAVQAALDRLEGVDIPRLRQDAVERQRLGQEIVQRGAGLSAALKQIASETSALTHVELKGVRASQQAVEATIRAGLAAYRSGDYTQAGQRFDEAEQALTALRRQVAALQETDHRIDELFTVLQRYRQEYLTLQARLALLNDPALAAEQEATTQVLARLAGVDPLRRLTDAAPLEALLAEVEPPERLQARVAARLGARAPAAPSAGEEEITARLADAQVDVETLEEALQNAERHGLLVQAERRTLEEWRTALQRAQEAAQRQAWEEAWTCLSPLDRRQLTELREGLERRIALAAALQLKTTLSLARVPEKGDVTRYNVILNISGSGWGDAGSIKGDIKVGYKDRVDLRQAIDDLTTVINLLFGTQGGMRGPRTQLRMRSAIESLASLGDMMYGLFLPVPIQEHLREAQTSVLLATDDLELPWELLHTGEDFLCMRNPVARMPIMNRFPRRNEYRRAERLRFLFIANPAGDLPASEREVDLIMSRLQGVEATVWKGAEVTNLRLHQAFRSGEYDVIHYSGHAFYNRETPNESGLVLADGSVFIADTIQRMLRGRPLVFLNACESGREAAEEEITYTGSEGEGLALSFILGGALGFIGTLWPIFDEGAAEFAVTFYEHLLGGEMIGEAMRQARLHTRQTRPNDVTWASFILYGDPTLRIRDEEPSRETAGQPPAGC